MSLRATGGGIPATAAARLLALQRTAGNAAVGSLLARAATGNPRRSLQRRVLTPNERKNDPSELKQAKRRVGMLRRWLERLPEGDLELTWLNRRRARWALLLDGTEPRFKLEPGDAARLNALLGKPSRPGLEKPSRQVVEKEYSSADFESEETEQAARALEAEFGFAAVTTAREKWTLSELRALAAALDLVPARDEPSLRGAIVVKEPAPGDGEDPDLRGEWDTAGGYHGGPRMRLMQSAFDDGIVVEVVLHEVGHAISVLRPERIAAFERVVSASGHSPSLVDPVFIRTFVSSMFADHVIRNLEAGDFREYLAEAYAIWLTDRERLPAPLVEFFDLLP